jgi:hypothetical protein
VRSARQTRTCYRLVVLFASSARARGLQSLRRSAQTPTRGIAAAPCSLLVIASTPAEDGAPGKGAGVGALRTRILSRSSLPAAKTRVGFATPKDAKGRAIGPVVIICKRDPTTTWKQY